MKNNPWIAKDGKSYDIVSSEVEPPLKPNEIEIIQYMRPTRRRRKLIAEVDEDTARKADDIVVSAEVLRNGKVAFYARHKDKLEETEICMIRENDTENPETGNKILKELINRCVESC